MSFFDVGSIILVFAATIGFVNERFIGLPRVIALLLGSLLLSLGFVLASRLIDGVDLAQISQRRIEGAHLPRILLDGMLALLLFAASLQVNLRGLRNEALAVLGLATVGVLIATALFTLSIWAVFKLSGMDVPIVWCFALGAILAPTDAVAVESLIKRIALPSSMKSLIVGESLFNDGTAVVVFLAALSAVAGEHAVIGHGRILFALLGEGGGGIVLGLASGFVASFLMRHIKDDVGVMTISLALALSTYRLAVAFGISGPLAVVVCGLMLADTDKGERERLIALWSVVEGLLNTLLFMLMGFEVLAMDLSAFMLIPVLAAVPLAFFSRFISVGTALSLLRFAPGNKLQATSLLTWVGLRGAVSVALVLTLPEGPYTNVLSAACYAVVIFTIVVQGLLTPRVVAALYPEAQASA